MDTVEQDAEGVRRNQGGESAQDRLAMLNLSHYRRAVIFLGIYWRAIFSVCWPILLLPVLLVFNSPESRCAYVIFIMGGFWVTECLPIAITSLIPVALFPAFGILSTPEICACYMNDTIMVFIGVLILGIATEHCNLHMRIALRVMATLGCSHARLLGGFCTVTTLISLWISNSATTAMMVPIVFAVLEELERQGLGQVFYVRTDPKRPEIEPVLRPTNVTKAYLFAAAYASTFAGTGTLIASPTNLAFKGIYEHTFPEADVITFGNWFIGSLPQLLVNNSLLWFYLRVAFLGYLRPNSKDAQAAMIGEEGERVANEVIREKLRRLGPMTFHEIAVTTLFVICIFLWVLRDPGFVSGWAELITDISLLDSMPITLIWILMFFIPKEPAFLSSFSRTAPGVPRKPSDGLMTWKVIHEKLPWRLVFLLGGGFAISRASSVSCLAIRIGEALVPLQNLPPILMLFVILFAVSILTEFTSNVGTATILLPVVAHMCVAMKVHPLFLMMPVTLMCSFAFRLPVSTPPNAIITAAGRMKTTMLVTAGCVPSLYSIIVQTVLFPTWGAFVYGIDDFPEWASKSRMLYVEQKCP